MNTPESASRLSPSAALTPSSAISSYGNDLDEDFNTMQRVENKLGREVDHCALLTAYRALKSTLPDKNPTTSMLVSELRRMGGYESVSESPFSFSPLPAAPAWNGKLVLEDDDDDNDVAVSNQDQFSRKSLSKPVPALKLMKSLSLSSAEPAEPEPEAQSFLSPHSIWSLLSVIVPERRKRSQASHQKPYQCAAIKDTSHGDLASHPINDLWDEEEEEEEDQLPMLPDSWWCVLDLISGQNVSTLPDRLVFGKQIAHTHYSTVFLGTIRMHQKEQAVVIKRMDVSDHSSKANIVAELVALRQIDGSGIAVRLLDFCFTDNGRTALIVLDRFQGNLRDWSQSGQRSIEDKLLAFARVCRLISSLHKTNIAHCDLKLDNLLINNGDISSMVLCDFSECCSISVSAETLLSHSRGTECYASPELHKATPTRPFSVDCWCLGCILYEIVTGKLLFPGKGDCLRPSVSSEAWPSPASEDAVGSIFMSQFESKKQARGALGLLQAILRPEASRPASDEIARRAEEILSF